MQSAKRDHPYRNSSNGKTLCLAESVTLGDLFNPVFLGLQYQMLKPLCPSTTVDVSQKTGGQWDQLGMAAQEETHCIVYGTKIKQTVF